MRSDFHSLAHGRMSIELFDQSGQDPRDWLLVTRNPRGDVVGQITLDGQVYAIRWRKVGAAG